MKRFILLSLLTAFTSLIHAQEDSTAWYSYFNPGQISLSSELQVNRSIKGGTVFLVEFEDEERWDEDMKGAFRYACKIWEEYLPTMLPIRVKVRMGNFRQRGNSMSKIVQNTLSGHDDEIASCARYMLLAEYNKGCNSSFPMLRDSIEMCLPDIDITYNQKMMNTDSVSFRLNAVSCDKIDFVTQVLRDLAIGLGFRTQFTPFNNTLSFPTNRRCVGLEIPVENHIYNSNPSIAYANATQGTVTLNIPQYGSLQLYAPSTWSPGFSLNTFVADEQHGISRLLTSQYGKGTAIRDIADDYESIFLNAFYWWPNFPTGSAGNTIFEEGSNVNPTPYQGTISMSNPNSNNTLAMQHPLGTDGLQDITNLDDEEYDEPFDYRAYCRPYDPTLSMSGTGRSQGWTFSLLKKDGTWDVIAQTSNVASNFDVNLSNTTFHFPEEQYARTTDNLLRGRFTLSYKRTYNGHEYLDFTCLYKALEHLPQKVQQNLAKEYEGSYIPDEYLRDIDIAMSNLEGATYVYLEQLEEGDSYPSLTLLSDFKKGRVLATVDKEYDSEFTIVSYNNNGYKRSETLYVPASEPARISLTRSGDYFSISYGHKNKIITDCQYEIYPLGNTGVNTIFTANRSLHDRVKRCLDGKIPLSELKEGLNIVKVTLPNGKSQSIKVVNMK